MSANPQLEQTMAAVVESVIPHRSPEVRDRVQRLLADMVTRWGQGDEMTEEERLVKIRGALAE